MKKKIKASNILTVVNIFIITILLLGSAAILWLTASGAKGIFGWQLYLVGDQDTFLSHAIVLVNRDNSYLTGDTVLLQQNEEIKSAVITGTEESIHLTLSESGETISVPQESILGRAVFYSIPIGKGIRYVADHSLMVGGGILILFFLVLLSGILLHLRQRKKTFASGKEDTHIVEEQLPLLSDEKQGCDLSQSEKEEDEKALGTVSESPELSPSLDQSKKETPASFMLESLSQIPIEEGDPAQLTINQPIAVEKESDRTDSEPEDKQKSFSESSHDTEKSEWETIEITMSDEELEQLKNQVLCQLEKEEKNEKL